MRHWFATVFTLGSCLGVLAEEEGKKTAELTDAKAILERTAEALKKVQTVSYEVEYNVTGWFAKFLPNIRGTIVIGKDTPQKVQRFHSTLTVQKVGSSESTEVNAGADGNIYFVIDPNTKVVYADIDPAVLGKAQWGVQFSMVREFAEAEPFADALKSGEVRPADSARVDEEDCYALWIKSPTNPEALWFFSKRDFLPRRISFRQTNDEGKEATAENILHKLTVNPTFVKNPFELVVPEGYTKTDEFAP
jgi:outer membrane lipoprotein-sorting protein